MSTLWTIVCFLSDVRLYHTVTSLPGRGIVVFGGRSSPFNAIKDLFSVTLGPSGQPGPLDSEGGERVPLCIEKMVCTGDPPPARWRHTATAVTHNGEIHKEIHQSRVASNYYSCHWLICLLLFITNWLNIYSLKFENNCEKLSSISFRA